MRYFRVFPALWLLLTWGASFAQSPVEKRLRLRDLGVQVGVFAPGKWNAITDVAGVRVGHVTLIEGEQIRTGLTAVLPHGENLFFHKVPAAIEVGNGFGKLMGLSQVEELGTIETPILLTGTLNVPRVADGLLDYMLSQPGMENVRSINPVVGETNDGALSEIRQRPLGSEHVLKAIEAARSGPVEEGAIGAGTGTICFGFKGGIGTSSRLLNSAQGGYTIGVLVQTNFDGILQVNGAPVGIELGRDYAQDLTPRVRVENRDGSCMIVVATDAPLEPRNLKRLAKRALTGMTAAGAFGSNGSGDYAIAFSVSNSNDWVENDRMTPLFQAAREATQEAIYNSLLMATSMTGRGGRTVESLPLERFSEILKKYRVIE